jgi:NAD(P)-dependent dehydrogenase (short-subunit alcohol dehydrogenase family)
MNVVTMRRILLTGGSRGIGAAIKQQLSKTYDVVTPSRSELNLLDSQSILDYVAKDHEFDILINNAGINIIKPTAQITNDDIRQINMINLEAPLMLVRALAPHMQQQKYGKIVSLSSIWGIRSKEQRVLYSGTKFGLIGQVKGLAREFAIDNVLVNAVCPGFTDTELTKASLSMEQREEMEMQVPLQRFAQPSEIAKLVEFLVGEQNTYLTGQAIVIDGGFTA